MTDGHDLTPGPSSGGAPIATFAKLDEIIALLGSTKTTLFPFLEGVGGADSDGLASYKETDTWLNPFDEVNAQDLEEQHAPYKHVGGVYSYYLNPNDNTFLRGQDDTNLGFPSNAPFSLGAFIFPHDITGVTVLSKYDINAQREWRLSLDGSSKLELEVYDETNNQDRTGASDTAVTAKQWTFVCATTLNTDLNSVMTFYLNGLVDGTGNTESGAAYASSPDTSAAFAIGAVGNTVPALSAQFQGRIALPFICGKVLSASDVLAIYGIGRTLLGLV